VLEQLLEGERRPGMEFDIGADSFAEDLVGDRHRRTESDARVGVDLVLDLRRRDVLSAPDDEVGDAPGDGEVAVVIDGAQVAHEHPAVGGVEPGVGPLVEIAEAGGRTAAGGPPLAARRRCSTVSLGRVPESTPVSLDP